VTDSWQVVVQSVTGSVSLLPAVMHSVPTPYGFLLYVHPAHCIPSTTLATHTIALTGLVNVGSVLHRVVFSKCHYPQINLSCFEHVIGLTLETLIWESSPSAALLLVITL